MTAVPHCCAPTDNRPDNTDRFGLASLGPLRRGSGGHGAHYPPMPCVRALAGPRSAAGAPRGLWTPPLPWTQRQRPQPIIILFLEIWKSTEPDRAHRR